MPSEDTKERIIEAAEQLFADTGFSGTSLRQLTRKANVNLAAVNYHFGSKDQLIQEIFRRRLDHLYDARREALDALQARYDGASPPLQEVLRAFIAPALTLSVEAAHGGSPFVKVLARAFVEYRDELRSFLSERYGDTNGRFFHAIADNVPHLDDQRLFLRIDFMVGALTYAMADFGVAKRPGDTDIAEYWEQAVNELVRFSEAGLTSPPETARA